MSAMGDADWIRPSGGRILVDVKVIPGAGTSRIGGFRAGALLARVAAPPEKGKANQELCVCVARALDLPKSEVALAAGATSRHKVLSLPADREEAVRALARE